MLKENYSFKKTVIKGLASVVIFAIPFLITEYPELANLTLGGLGVMLVNFLKFNLVK